MHAVIISIGDELLIGQVVNTNAAFIAEKLQSVGIEVRRMMVVPDSEPDILHAFEEVREFANVVIVTGGLGPTHDDITRSAICKHFKRELVTDEETLVRIKDLLVQRNIKWSHSAEDQARVPQGATVIPNKHGTAPGILLEDSTNLFIAMPGVPHEMEAMITDSVVPYLRARSSVKTILHRTLKTTGIPEAFLATRIGNVEDFLGEARLAFLPSPTGTRLRITVVDEDKKRANERADEIENVIRSRAGKYIYATGDEELESVVGRLLTEHKFTIAVAESCTGGLIANRITNVSGSSAYFKCGMVAYSNLSKQEMLGVPREIIEAHGAVSREVAEAMATGIRQRAPSDIGLSTTGIAGPTGATTDKPIGLIWIGYADSKESFALKFNFPDNRLRFKERASQAALELLRRRILRLDLTEQHLI